MDILLSLIYIYLKDIGLPTNSNAGAISSFCLDEGVDVLLDSLIFVIALLCLL